MKLNERMQQGVIPRLFMCAIIHCGLFKLNKIMNISTSAPRNRPAPRLGGAAVKCVMVALAAALLSTGCATPQYAFNLNARMEDQDRVWPAPPEVPRYRYMGELNGETNFMKKENGTFRKVLNVIAGIITGSETPVILQRPQNGMVGEDGNIYITDVSRQAVFVFDRDEGLKIWEMAKKDSRFLSPIAVASGKNGEILVTDSELGFVSRLDEKGEPVGVIGEGLLKRPTGITRDPENGLIFVADTYAHDIKVFSDDGELVRTIGKRGEKKGSLNYPIHIALSEGKLYITDTLNARVQVFSTDGDFLMTFGKRGLYKGNFTRPKGIAIDSDGNIYVVESYYDYLLVYDKKGRFLLPLGGTGASPGRFYLPAGVWIDENDRVFVADMFNRRVVVFQYLGGS